MLCMLSILDRDKQNKIEDEYEIGIYTKIEFNIQRMKKLEVVKKQGSRTMAPPHSTSLTGTRINVTFT